MSDTQTLEPTSSVESSSQSLEDPTNNPTRARSPRGVGRETRRGPRAQPKLRMVGAAGRGTRGNADEWSGTQVGAWAPVGRGLKAEATTG